MSPLPNGWKSEKLASIASRVTKGSTPTSYGFKYLNQGIAFVKIENLENGRINRSTIKHFISEEANTNQKRSVLEAGDILFSIAGTIGRTCLVSAKDLPANTNQALAIIRGTAAVLDSSFLRYQLESEVAQKQSDNQKRGGGMLNISLADVGNLDVLVAPLNEQKRIVEKLENLLVKVEAAQERLDKIPAILKRFRRSVLAAACSGKLTADWRGGTQSEDLPTSWSLLDIQKLLSKERKGMKTGPFGSMLKKSEHQQTGIPVFGIENIGKMQFIPGSKIHITVEKAEELSEYGALPGDVLISRSGTVGEVCVVPPGIGEARISTNLMRIVLSTETILPTLFCFLFNGSPFVLEQIRELCKGSTRDFLNQGILNALSFPLPPLEEQKEIVRRVEELFKFAGHIDERYKEARRYTDKLTQSILAKAFRGELVPQDPNDEPAADALLRLNKTDRSKTNQGKR